MKLAWRRAEAGESSQGQAQSAPPLHRNTKPYFRPEGAERQDQATSKSDPQFLCTRSAGNRVFDRATRGAAFTRLPLATFFHSFGVRFALPLLLAFVATGLAQTRTYPKEIRGYKVERVVVEIKRPEEIKKPERKTGNPASNQTQRSSENSAGNTGQTNDPPRSDSYADSDTDALIKLGKPQLARVTPLGITFEVPIVVAPVKQKGHIDFLVFEDMVVNGRSVEIDEYHREFDLPNKQPLTLREPLSFYIYLPGALLAAVDEWSNSKETWPVTGRVYVFAKFKKFGISFKRCIPVELKATMRNPLKEN